MGVHKENEATLVFLFMAVVVVIAVLPHQLAYAQFIPCKIVTFNVVPSALIQTGQPFQVTTNLTVSCDPSILPVVRVDLLDASSSKILSTNAVPYYPSASSFPASVVNQLTARQLTGSWALQDQAYVISGLNGQSVASSSELFQVNVTPYTPPVTEMQTTTETSTQSSNSSTAITPVPGITAPQNATEAATTSQSQPPVNQAPSTSQQLLLPAAILFIGLVVFGLLIFGSRRKTRPMQYCERCGTALKQDSKYCTNCGAKRET